jgi:tRNA-Thr(GGU) m(6)t(6)A37 methyltransferase TsaA
VEPAQAAEQVVARLRAAGRARPTPPPTRHAHPLASDAVKIEMQPIGRVDARRQQATDDHWGGSEACIVLDERFPPESLDGLESFSHVEVLFFFDRVPPEKVVSAARRPRNNPDWPAVGIFAQRGKGRPNRIGSTICRVLRREGRKLHVAELDAIDGTPVLDLKPVLAELLPRGELRQPAWSSELMRAYWLGEGEEPG